MENSMNRILVTTIVKNAIHNLKKDPDRTTRNLVDMASRFADSRFQEHFYGRIQDMLQNESSAYYALVRNSISKVNEETLLTFCMNLGYNGLYLGASKIRKQEKELGYNIPWIISLTIQEGRVYDPHHKLIRQGEKMGIHSWYLFSDHAIHECITIAESHPDSSFVIFCGSHEVDGAVLDIVSDCRNIALVVPFDKDADVVCDLLHHAEILYGLYYSYQESDLPAIESGELLEEMQQLHPVACIFKPKFPCQTELQQRIYNWIVTARMEQKHQTIPFELYGDIQLVDSVISDNPIWVGFDEYGQLNTNSGVDRTYGLNIFVNDLPEILKRAFPLSKGSVTP